MSAGDPKLIEKVESHGMTQMVEVQCWKLLSDDEVRTMRDEGVEVYPMEWVESDKMLTR